MIITDITTSSRYQASLDRQTDMPETRRLRQSESPINSRERSPGLELIETSANNDAKSYALTNGTQPNDKNAAFTQQQIEQETDKRVEEAKRALGEIKHNRLEFSVYEETGQTVVKVIDQKTGDVIKQLPPEELLELAAKLKEMSGVLFDKKI